jgi:hypothetical protein
VTFENIEESRDLGEPIDLFFFRYGSAANAYFAYTSGEQEFLLDGIYYTPIPIQRGKFTASGTLDKTQLEVSVPSNTDIADLFRTYPPGQVVTMLIRQGHANDPDMDFPVIWSGRVVQCERKDSVATLTGEPINTSLRRAGLRRNYQLSCPHVLYGAQCRASKIAATTTTEVINMTGTRVTLQDGWSGAIDPVKYVGGMIEWSAPAGLERRTILRVVDLKTLLLSGPTTGISPGMNIDVILGCNHQMGVEPQPDGDCLTLHNNIHNFGGQPWIPTSNPINTNPFS